MKLRDVDMKYVTLLIVGSDGKVYLCMPHWPSLVQVEIKEVKPS